jgi:hypothetical protein
MRRTARPWERVSPTQWHRFERPPEDAEPHAAPTDDGDGVRPGVARPVASGVHPGALGARHEPVKVGVDVKGGVHGTLLGGRTGGGSAAPAPGFRSIRGGSRARAPCARRAAEAPTRRPPASGKSRPRPRAPRQRQLGARHRAGAHVLADERLDAAHQRGLGGGVGLRPAAGVVIIVVAEQVPHHGERPLGAAAACHGAAKSVDGGGAVHLRARGPRVTARQGATRSGASAGKGGRAGGGKEGTSAAKSRPVSTGQGQARRARADRQRRSWSS